MKILYDHQIFTQQQYGGISRYFYELIKRHEGQDNSCDVATFFSDNAYYNKTTNPSLKNFFPNLNFKGKSRIIKEINEQVSKRTVKKGDFDVFHPTYYDPYFLKQIQNKPFVVTFYDMIHEKFESQFPDLKVGNGVFNDKKLLLEKASRIIAISETTKKDIIEIFNVNSSKIDVVYLGNSLNNFDFSENRLVYGEYILFVGNRGGYKNFNLFLLSITDLLKKYNIKLVCAGGGNFNIEELLLIKNLNLESNIEFKKISSDSILANFYKHALFFVFPSLYEGFGIPVLESFECKCPALLSNGGSLPEVGGNSALYFDPVDSQSIFNSVDILINDSSLRNTLKDKGSKRAKDFSWDKTFSDTLDVYKKII